MGAGNRSAPSPPSQRYSGSPAAPAAALPWAGSSGLAAALLGAYLALTIRGSASYYGGLLSGWLLLPLWAASQYALLDQAWDPHFDGSLPVIHAIAAGIGFAMATLVSALRLERRADGSRVKKASPTRRVIGKAHRLGLEKRPSPVKSDKTKKAAAKPKAAPAAAPPKVAKEKPGKGGTVTLLDLTDRMCKWPIGHPGEENFHFCGKNAQPGMPYCGKHCLEAYQAQPPRKDRARARPAR